MIVVNVVAVCDAIADKADAVADRYGCKAYSSVNEMIQSEQIDIASVCTAGVENGGDHYEPTMALLGAGIPVLGEKPISNRIPEAREKWWRLRRKRISDTGSI